MKKLYIHIGAHKTGTTLLQTVLKRNKENLKKQSVLFAEEFYLIFQKENVKAFYNPRESDFSTLASKLNTLARTDEDSIVISYEGLAGALTSRHPYLYHNSQHSAEMLKEITSQFDTSIIVATRRQDNFIESAYHQTLKWGTDRKFQLFAQNNHNSHHLEWSKLIKKYESYFSSENVHVLPYELCIENKTEYVSNFFDIFSDSQTLEMAIKTVVNPSYSKAAMNISLFFNSYLSTKNKMRLRLFLQRKFPKKPGKTFQLYTDRQRDEVLKFYRNDNKLLFAKYLTAFDDGYYLGEAKRLRKRSAVNSK